MRVALTNTGPGTQGRGLENAVLPRMAFCDYDGSSQVSGSRSLVSALKVQTL